MASQHASKRFVKIKRCGCWGYHRSLFPTTLCGVLVFDSVSRVCSASSRLLLPPPASTSTHVTYHNFTHTNLTYNNFTHTHTHSADAAAVCVAGVALGDIHLRFTWQVWYLETSTFVLRGRRGIIFDTPSFTHHFVTHHLSNTIFHTQLCHTPSLTHHL